MNILETIMGQLGGGEGQGLEQQVAGMIAQKLGIDPAVAQSAIAALTKNHTLPNDTVTAAAQETGLSGDLMSQILGQIGGEGALGSLIGQIGGAGGKGEEGGIAGALGGMLGGLMGGDKK